MSHCWHGDMQPPVSEHFDEVLRVSTYRGSTVIFIIGLAFGDWAFFFSIHPTLWCLIVQLFLCWLDGWSATIYTTLWLSFGSLISKMLVKDPQRRITLEAMMSDPWLLLVFDPVIPTPVPLVTQLGLTAEEYKRVVDKMEAGNIADRETIKR